MLVLVVALTLGTSLLGWWVVPALGAIWGAARGRQRDALGAGLAAIAAWGILLAGTSVGGPVGELAATIGDILGFPAFALVLFALLVAGLLAASAAGAAAGVRAALIADPSD